MADNQNTDTPKPFKDVFNGTVMMIPNKGSRNPGSIIWKKNYNIRIIEANPYEGEGEPFGTIISRVEVYFKKIYGSDFFKNPGILFQLLDKRMDELLQRNAKISGLGDPYTDNPDDIKNTNKLQKKEGKEGGQILMGDPRNPGFYLTIKKENKEQSLQLRMNVNYLPSLYNRGQVPAEYKESNFHKDKIWPGQRFIIMWPKETINFIRYIRDFELPKPDKLWAGITAGFAANYYAVGAHAQFGAILNAGDLFAFRQRIRNAALVIQGISLGPGHGVSGGLNVVFFVNHETYPDSDEYSDLYFDWDLALGCNLKFSDPFIEQFFVKLAKFKGKHIDSLPQTKKNVVNRIQYLGTVLLKNFLGNDFSDKKYELVIPIPFLNNGIHAFIGVKTSKFNTFPEERFGKEMTIPEVYM